MKQRSYLKGQIIRAWLQTIERDYNYGRINSERSLQASLWASLNDLLPRNRNLFIEPFLNAGEKLVCPDIVITNSREVVAVIELKYLPRAQPKYEKDVATLAFIAQQRIELQLYHRRHRGVRKDYPRYRMAKHILFVWAGVHKPELLQSEFLYADGRPELDGCFMELHAETQSNGLPNIYQRY